MFRHFTAVKHPKLLTENWAPHTERFYCGHCVYPFESGEGFINLSTAQFHICSQHDRERDELVEGEDYLLGPDLWTKLHRYWDECDRDVSFFTRTLETIANVDDFLIDFGTA